MILSPGELQLLLGMCYAAIGINGCNLVLCIQCVKCEIHVIYYTTFNFVELYQFKFSLIPFPFFFFRNGIFCDYITQLPSSAALLLDSLSVMLDLSEPLKIIDVHHYVRQSESTCET